MVALTMNMASSLSKSASLRDVSKLAGQRFEESEAALCRFGAPPAGQEAGPPVGRRLRLLLRLACWCGLHLR
jgi:hypothetical protein